MSWGGWCSLQSANGGEAGFFDTFEPSTYLHMESIPLTTKERAADARERAQRALTSGDDAGAQAWLLRARIFERMARLEDQLLRLRGAGLTGPLTVVKAGESSATLRSS